MESREREKQDMPLPFLLTQEEADSLRQEMQASYEWMKQELQRRRMESVAHEQNQKK